MSEACGRRRLAKLVFATGASGNLRGFLEEGVHASYNYRLTDPFVFHVAFLEGHLRSESDSKSALEEAAKYRWEVYLEERRKNQQGIAADHSSDPEKELKPYEDRANTLGVAAELLWALDNDVDVLPDSDKEKKKLLEKKKNELLEKWDTLKLKEEHLNSIKKVSDEARKAAERLKAWQNASEEQKKAAEELIEVASKGNLTNQDDAERVLRAIAEKTFEDTSVPRYRPNLHYTKCDELREVYGGSKVAWALDQKKGEITDDLLECRAAKKALLDWKAEKAKEAKEAKEKWCREHTSPELLRDLARNTIVKVRGDKSCWNTPDAQARLDEVEKNMSTFVESAENASQRAKEAAERAEKATERAKDALQTARKAALSVKKPEASDWRGTSSTHHHDIRTDATAGSKAPSKQPDNGSGSTPKLQSEQVNSSVQQQTRKSQPQTVGLPNAGSMWMKQEPQNSNNIPNIAGHRAAMEEQRQQPLLQKGRIMNGIPNADEFEAAARRAWSDMVTRAEKLGAAMSRTSPEEKLKPYHHHAKTLSVKNASQTAGKAPQSAQSMKKSNASDISRIQQPDSKSRSTPKPPSAHRSEFTPLAQTDGLQQAKSSVQQPEEMSKSRTFPCEPTIKMIVGISLLGFIVYAVWKAIRPVSSQNLMAKSAVKKKVKSRAASMVAATGMPKTNHEEGGLCSQLV